MVLGIALHVVAAGLWLGGLFFTYLMLRPHPAVARDVRFSISRQALARFLVWAQISIAALLLSGFALTYLAFGGLTRVPHYVRVMMALGVLSALTYAYVYLVPWRRFRRAVLTLDWTAADRKLRHLRVVLAVMLLLAAAAMVTGAAGRYFG